MGKRSKLLLFDVDCTLVNTGGAGLTALAETCLEVFEAEGPALDLAGSTDSGIVRGIFAHFGREFDPELEATFYEAYLPKLVANLHDKSFGGRVLLGVPELLADCEEAGHTLGLLTGNIARGGAIKVGHYGLAEHFQFGAYGDDHWDRNLLGPIAIERANRHSGKDFSAKDAIVIGDTHKDINCAHAMGSPCLAVATGSQSSTELAAAGGELVVEDLTDPRVRDFLFLG